MGTVAPGPVCILSTSVASLLKFCMCKYIWGISALTGSETRGKLKPGVGVGYSENGECSLMVEEYLVLVSGVSFLSSLLTI